MQLFSLKFAQVPFDVSSVLIKEPIEVGNRKKNLGLLLEHGSRFNRT